MQEKKPLWTDKRGDAGSQYEACLLVLAVEIEKKTDVCREECLAIEADANNRIKRHEE